MRFFAALIVFESPIAAATWFAFHSQDSGVEGGLYWLLGFVALLVAAFVAAVIYEGKTP